MAGQNQDPALQNLPGEYVEEGDVLAANSTTPQTTKNKPDLDKDNKLREILANVYTFVRSQEINRVIGGFTFDHYIDEAKRSLKGTGRQVVDAAGTVISQDPKIGMRPSQLDYLTQIQTDFNNSYTDLLAAAKTKDNT